MALALRKARMEDADAIMEIIEDGRSALRERGIDQWSGPYPQRSDIERDIAEGSGYAVVDADGDPAEAPVAYFSLFVGEDPAYEAIEGAWKTSAPYGAIHRLASAARARGRGVGRAAFALAEKECRRLGLASIRVDTHEDNGPMRHLAEAAGFECRGIVQCGGDRLAFEKVLGRG